MSDPDRPDDGSDGSDGRVPDEYRMEGDERPDNVRRRNLITGLVFLLVIGTIIGITIYTRATAAGTLP